MQYGRPQDFLPRMSTVVDTIMDDKWRFDRDVIQIKLPD
jgi:hypothetical protein